MSFQISDKVRNAQADGIMDALDTGTIELRTGVQPTLITDPATGTLIATLTLLSPAAPAASGGFATASLPVLVTSTVAGTIGYARVKDLAGNTMIDGTVTEAGGGGDIIISEIIIAIDDVVQLISFTVTAPTI